MRIRIGSAGLRRALERVQGAVERSRGGGLSDEGITSHLLLEASGGRLELTGTDMHMLARTEAEAEVEAEGSCTASAEILVSAAKALRAREDAELSHEDGSLSVASGDISFSLPSREPGEFPSFAQEPGEGAVSFSMPAADLRSLFRRTLFCVSSNETRYYLNGVYLHSHEKMLTAAATDGLRLACSGVPLPRGASKLKGVIVPRRAVVDLQRLLESEAAEEGARVEVEADSSLARFRFGAMDFTTKLVDGAFPDYRRVIPKTRGATLSAEPGPLGEALERAQVVTDPRESSLVRFSLDAEKGVSLSSGSPSRGRFRDRLEAEYEGDPLEIGFNARLLREIVLKAAEGDDGAAAEGARLSVGLTDSSTPILLQAEGAGGSTSYVLMPLRT